MERGELREIAKKYALPLACARLVVFYFIFLLIAKYSSFFATGIIPKDIVSSAIGVCLLMYRLLVIAVVPALLFMWLADLAIRLYRRQQ
jgi:uncharacterized membrane protein (DUF485 family)